MYNCFYHCSKSKLPSSSISVKDYIFVGTLFPYTGITSILLKQHSQRYVKFKLKHYIQCRHLIPTLNAWAARAVYTTACAIATQFPGLGCMDDLTTKRSFDSQAAWVIDVLGLFFDMLSMSVCTIGHWQTYGRLVQELNVDCTVPIVR